MIAIFRVVKFDNSIIEFFAPLSRLLISMSEVILSGFVCF